MSSDEVILDTCALIDGRIVDLVRSGFLQKKLVISKAVVDELQYLADHADAHKRARARYGLDVANELQNISKSVEIVPQKDSSDVPVDEQLVRLAAKRNAQLYTTDFNLNKVAKIHGVTVLNINELAQYLRPPLLPGETAEVKIIERGQEKNQGIAYLDDGTMIVIENGASRMNKKVNVTFSRLLQTQAGRMMFAQLTQPTRQESRKR
jgi:uncharacterized protein YacL